MEARYLLYCADTVMLCRLALWGPDSYCMVQTLVVLSRHALWGPECAVLCRHQLCCLGMRSGVQIFPTWCRYPLCCLGMRCESRYLLYAADIRCVV